MVYLLNFLIDLFNQVLRSDGREELPCEGDDIIEPKVDRLKLQACARVRVAFYQVLALEEELGQGSALVQVE